MMPLFVNRSGEGVYVRSNPRIVGQKPKLSAQQEMNIAAEIWGRMHDRGMSYRDIERFTGFHNTTIMRAVKRVRSDVAQARDLIDGGSACHAA